MESISVEQYQDALKNANLSFNQIRVLKLLYESPNSSATAKELAFRINPNSPAPIKASGAIGKTGKKICQYLNIHPGFYMDGKIKRIAYFSVIGEYNANIGWNMWKYLQEALKSLNHFKNDYSEQDLITLPTEVSGFTGVNLFKEGKLTQTFVNKYERNREARDKCIEYYAAICKVCQFDFEKMYGKIGIGFIHVHHEIELSSIKKEYSIDPIKHLKPVCPNCHSMLHKKIPAYTISQLQEILFLVAKGND